jgi:hypothetical protein
LPDPRRRRSRVSHPLLNIVVMELWRSLPGVRRRHHRNSTGLAGRDRPRAVRFEFSMNRCRLQWPHCTVGPPAARPTFTRSKDSSTATRNPKAVARSPDSATTALHPSAETIFPNRDGDLRSRQLGMMSSTLVDRLTSLAGNN